MAVNIFEHRRIMVVGNNGSGKSFLSRRLADITGLPLVHLDAEYWRPNWQAPPRDEWLARQAQLTSAERWIIDGNHSGTMEVRYAAADLVILLDVNRLTCLAGIVRRRGRPRPDMPAYIVEKWDGEFLRFCRGLWRFPKVRRPKIIALHEKYPGVPLLVIKGRREANRLLRAWRDDAARRTGRV